MRHSGGEANNEETLSKLIFKINTRFFCGYNFLVKCSLLVCALYSKRQYGQDTIALKSIEIYASKIHVSQIGKKTEAIDSTIQQKFKLNSVAELLSLNSSVFIKSYGPGAIASTALRGGNASQTALLWNGFNLQNAMLGQADLALLPSVLFDNIEIEYGGSSSLWGSGAVGGSIHLNNKTRFNQGIISSTNIGGGSFGLKSASANILISKRKFISSTKVYQSSSENNFKYRDVLDNENSIKRQKYGNYCFRGLMQEFKFLINSKQILSFHFWANSNQRHLPSISNFNDTKQFQNDDALRLTANWNYIKANFKSLIKTGLFYDRINYTDSMAAIFSKSKVRTVIAENENYVTWNKLHQLNFGINMSSSEALTNNYESNKTLTKVSLLVGNKFSIINNRLIVYASTRAEYFSVGTLPVTGNIALSYTGLKNLSIQINTAKVYRQPTLNELFWQPGGNILLKPEQGYTYEGSLNYKKQIRYLSISISGAMYTRQINNWILWLPGEKGNPSPVNIQQVWSRGGETNGAFKYRKNKIEATLSFGTSYVLSTIQADKQENNNNLNKQLIYTPRYTANGNISLGYENFYLIYFHQYIGYRFTSSDNANWLLPYQTSSVKLNHILNLKSIKFILFAACNNLFNANYSIVANRPMPLRNYEIGITIQTKNKNNKL